jgi:hypothetical protein
MMRRRVPVLLVAACGTVLLSLQLGCAIALDLLNPGVFSVLGIDPAAISGRRGTVIMNFRNNSDGVAVFYAFESADAIDLTIDSRNFSAEVAPGESRNEVLSCPVAVLSPGSLSAAYAFQPLAASVVSGTGATTVDYLGTPLLDGSDFRCGYVIDVQLSGTGGNYTLSVRVIPG